MTSREPVEDLLARVSMMLADAVDRETAPGLLTGSCGFALFYAYRFAWSQDEQDVDRVHHVVQQIMARVTDDQLGASFAGGLAGIGWCLQHLLGLGFLDEENDEILTKLDPILAHEMDRALAASEYDLLHQGLGIALYFLERSNERVARGVLARVVDRLEATAVGDGDVVRWEDRFTDARGAIGPRFNLGLAHGTPAILAVLAKLSRRGIEAARIEPLLRGTVRWLRATRLSPSLDRLALYPTTVGADHRAPSSRDSRLGWCYGDLGVAVALGHAGTALHDPEILAETRAILRHSLDHRSPANGTVSDAGLCHGSLGISHIYRRGCRLTDEVSGLEVGVTRWLDVTLDLARAEVGLRAEQAGRFVACNDLLQGVAGIGLGLLAAIDADTAPDWDRCMLFS